MKVLVACEFSGVVRDAFTAVGCDAWSCDLEPSETPGYHYEGDVRDIINKDWDLVIAHPPCTYLCRSGARWKDARKRYQEDAINFFAMFLFIKAPRVCIENPIGIMSRLYRQPHQIIQPWQFGHPETKATCLWLKNLPPLIYTDIVTPVESKVHYLSKSPTRSAERSRTHTGIAAAMADQWGSL